jgi:hypothetical protein
MDAGNNRAQKCLQIFNAGKWSGIRESNPRLHLGKVAYYHYTNPANREVPRPLFIYSTRCRIATSGTRRVLSTPPPSIANTRQGCTPTDFARPAYFNPLPECERSAPPAISSGGRQTVPRVRDRYTRARIFRRLDRTPSLASDDVSSGGRDVTGIAFWEFFSWSISFSFSILTALVSAGHA